MQERLYGPAGMARTALDFDAGAADPDRAAPHAVDLLLGRAHGRPAGPRAGRVLGHPRRRQPPGPAPATWPATSSSTWAGASRRAGAGWCPRPRCWRRASPTRPLGGRERTSAWAGWSGSTGAWSTSTYGGGNLGYTSYVALLPAADLGVAVLTNAALAAPFTQAVADYVLRGGAGAGAHRRRRPPGRRAGARRRSWPSSAPWSGPAPSPGRSPASWAATATSPGWRRASTPPAPSS